MRVATKDQVIESVEGIEKQKLPTTLAYNGTHVNQHFGVAVPDTDTYHYMNVSVDEYTMPGAEGLPSEVADALVKGYEVYKEVVKGKHFILRCLKVAFDAHEAQKTKDWEKLAIGEKKEVVEGDLAVSNNSIRSDHEFFGVALDAPNS